MIIHLSGIFFYQKHSHCLWNFGSCKWALAYIYSIKQLLLRIEMTSEMKGGGGDFRFLAIASRTAMNIWEISVAKYQYPDPKEPFGVKGKKGSI